MSHADPATCPVCGDSQSSVAYEGPVRAGAFGNLTEPVQVLKCSTCGTGRLSVRLEDAADFYESDRYRVEVDGASGADAFHAAHDAEQAIRLSMVGAETLRGVDVADVGCGAGAFLDAAGDAASRVAIEPSETFRAHLAGHGYRVFPYACDALEECAGGLDLVTCFSVLEHVEEPAVLLRDMRALLRPGGRLVLSTPNARDFLLDALPVDYARFFYRKAHLTYFDEGAIRFALRQAGFDRVEVRYVQRFGLGNAIGWLRDRKPQGDLRLDFVTDAMEASWRSELERLGVADYLYVDAFAGEAR